MISPFAGGAVQRRFGGSSELAVQQPAGLGERKLGSDKRPRMRFEEIAADSGAGSLRSAAASRTPVSTAGSATESFGEHLLGFGVRPSGA